MEDDVVVVDDAEERKVPPVDQIPLADYPEESNYISDYNTDYQEYSDYNTVEENLDYNTVEENSDYSAVEENSDYKTVADSAFPPNSKSDLVQI